MSKGRNRVVGALNADRKRKRIKSFRKDSAILLWALQHDALDLGMTQTANSIVALSHEMDAEVGRLLK